MTRQDSAVPARPRPSHDDLNQLKRQAKDLLKLYRAGDAEALAEVQRLYHDADAATFALHDAQLVVARRHGFESWIKLKEHVDRATVAKLARAAEAGDVSRIRAMLKARPELVNMDLAADNEHRAIHLAALHRQPDAVRVLMEAGADARKGIYPHRDATTALTIAKDRGYDEIVAIIEAEEQHRRESMSCPNATVSPVQDELNDAIRRGDDATVTRILEADPTLIRACDRQGATPLHVAAGALDRRIVGTLLALGADVKKTDLRGSTPLDRAVLAGHAQMWESVERVVGALIDRGAAVTARAAVAMGDVDWLKSLRREPADVRHGDLESLRGGLLSLAVLYDRINVVRLLLDLGFDVNERVRLTELEEQTFSWSMPLWHAAAWQRYEIAELLLSRGADPNGQVYASGSPVFQAYGVGDAKMLELLKRFGGMPDAPTAGLFRDVELARQMLEGQQTVDPDRDKWAGQTVAEQLLWGAACAGSVPIVEMALARVDWPREDHRWFGILDQPLRFWKYGNNRPNARPMEFDRNEYLDCFGLILKRADANVIGRFGRTMLHCVAGFGGRMTAEERTGFARLLLDAGARLDVRDEILRSTPLGWACRWGHMELVHLLLDRGASANELDGEPWTRPLAWAARMGHARIVELLSGRGSSATSMR